MQYYTYGAPQVVKEKALYIRLSAQKHRQLSQLVAYWETSLSCVIEQAIDQILFQCVEDFEPPVWLLLAVENGDLPIRRFGDVGHDADDHIDNVVNLPGCR